MDPSAYLSVKVHPNAGKDALLQMGTARYEAWVRAKPVQGDANEAVTNLLARSLQVSRDRLRITKGRSSRSKVFRVVR